MKRPLTAEAIIDREIANYRAQALVSGTATAWTIPAIVEVLERIAKEIKRGKR